MQSMKYGKLARSAGCHGGKRELKFKDMPESISDVAVPGNRRHHKKGGAFLNLAPICYDQLNHFGRL